MEIDDLRRICAENKIQMPEKAFENVANSVKAGRYSFEEVASHIQEKPAHYRDLYNYREMIRHLPEPSSVTTVKGLHEYVQQINIVVPKETMTAMEESIARRENSPSQLAQHLKGIAYQQFLQSTAVPRLSDAEHKSLKDSLGNRYQGYIESLERVAAKTGLTLPALNNIAELCFKDKPEAMKQFASSLSTANPPQVRAGDEKSIKDFASSVGVYCTETRSKLCCDLGMNVVEIKSHLVRSAAERFSTGPEVYAETVRALNQKKEITHELSR